MKKFFHALFYSRRIRILLISCVIFLLVFSALDYCFETRGIPGFAVRKIECFFAARGYIFQAESVTIGVVNGFRLRDFSVSGDSRKIALSAKNAILEFTPSELFKGTLLPFRFEVEDGTLSIPVFPEYGEESKYDRIVFSKLRARMSGIPGMLKICSAEGHFNGILFRMRGTVDNLLHFSGMKGIDFLKGYFSGKTEEPSADFSDYIKNVPLDLRKKLLTGLLKIDGRKFDGRAVCDINFQWNLTDFKHCSAEADLFIPAFRFGRLKVESIRERITLRDGNCNVNSIRLDLSDGAFLNASARYSDVSGGEATGTFSGNCRIGDILLFFPDPAQTILRHKLGRTKDRVTFKGELKEFSTTTGKFGGTLSVDIPQLEIDGLLLQNASLTVNAAGEKFTGTLHKADLPGGGTLSGKFTFDGKTFSANLEGAALVSDIRKILPKDVNDIISKNVKLSSVAPVAFKGLLKTPDWEKKDFSGSFDVMVPGLSLKQIDIRRLTATIEFSPETVRVIGMNALLSDESRLRGDFFCHPEEKTISARLVCTGNPEKIILSLGPEYRDFLGTLTEGIVWPAAAHSIEAVADLHIRYGAKPSHYLTGSLILRDFVFRGIKFRYGAARFLIRPDNIVLLPDIVLETSEGRLSMSAVYEPEGKFRPDKPLSGKLRFELSSSISGNDMIRSLYPDWKSEFVDFPIPIRVEARGMIDYSNDAKTRFRAQILNGSCLWNGMKINDIDVIMRYADETIDFQHAEGSFCGGRLGIDYRYRFNTESGSMRFKLLNADVNEFLSMHRVSGVIREKNALSGDMEGNFYYTKSGLLMIDGQGGFELTGKNLWSVPLLGPFMRLLGDAWSLDEFGSVTRIDGKFVFKDDTFRLGKVRSNGGIISIDAKGFYRWNTNDFDVTFRALLLKNTLPFNAMSRLLQPVSWMLEKRFKGNAKTYEWMEKNERKH